MGSSAIISIVVVTDEHYMILLAALIKSIELNHKTGEKILLYIIADGVKTRTKNKLQEAVDPQMTELIWISAADANPANLKLPIDKTSFPLTIYLRLFIQNVVVPGTEKALFLDVDMIVLEDVSRIWNTDLGDKVIGAVQDPRLLTFDNSWGGILNYKALNLAGDTKYFNTGLLLINITQWAAQRVTERVIKCVNDNIAYANYPDQYGLNIVLANQWYQLDARWNYFASGDLEDPFIIHFISRKPIYKSYSNNLVYKQIFNRYLDQTVFGHIKPVGEISRYLKKSKNIIIKIRHWFLDKIL